MKRLGLVVLVVLIAGAVATYQSLPPYAQSLSIVPALPTPVRGVIHVHTRRSDGTGTVDDVAAAAARAGLAFVILTDHGDGSRVPEAPTYRRGVLCIDAVEISTEGGHLVALGLPPSPYPLGGEARDVVEDVLRLGGMAIAAHVSSAKEALRWTDWNAPVHGLEWLNGDSEWRDEPVWTLARALLTYPFRHSETLASLLDRPETLRRWDEMSTRRPIVAVAAADAHARIELGGADPYDDRISPHIPGYEQVFRTFSITLPRVTLSANASADARVVIDAIRQGHVFSSIDAIAGPVAMSFSASSGRVRAEMGDLLQSSGPLVFEVKTNVPSDAAISLMRDGRVVKTAPGPVLEHTTTETGVYRIEIHWPGAPGQPSVPWVISNPIYVGERSAVGEVLSRIPAAEDVQWQYENGPAPSWRVEKSPESQGVLDVVPTVGGTQLSIRYAIGGTRSENPYAAVAMPAATGLSGFDRLMFTARANRPMRLSVQVRVPGESQEQRWHRSVYLDETARPIVVMFDDMTPRGPTSSTRPDLVAVRDVLFVVDTANARPGTNGQLWLDDVGYGR